MAFDWQTVMVALAVLAATLYVGRRGWSRLRSFRAAGGGKLSDCASGCGSCGEDKQVSAPRPPVKVLVQIDRSRPVSTRRSAR